jgi:amino acid transporter
MCGKPADLGCAARLVLHASSAQCLDAMGYPVQRGRGQDKVRIEMPRCASCRSWISGWIAVLAVVTIAAGIAGTIMQSFFFAGVAPPAGLKVYHEGIGNTGTGVGVVLGFVVAILAMAWERKRSGRKSANTYPPVVSLRQLGWSFISD